MEGKKLSTLLYMHQKFLFQRIGREVRVGEGRGQGGRKDTGHMPNAHGRHILMTIGVQCS